MHDETYKKLFAFPDAVEDLLRGFVDGPRPDEIDFATLQNEMVGPELAPYQPAQRYCVVDERRLVRDDLPSDNVMSSVVLLEQAGPVADLAYVLESLPATDPLPGTLKELKMSVVERAAEWPKKWMQEGVDQGLAQQRALLRRQAARRFGDDVAARVSDAVERIADPERLAVVGEWLVEADSGGDLVARLMTFAEGRDTP